MAIATVLTAAQSLHGAIQRNEPDNAISQVRKVGASMLHGSAATWPEKTK
jgi:hypothetical protein